jgi:DNA transposition AAA+ family ATPase
MNTSIVILASGDELIGDMAVFEDYVEVYNPMYIIDGEVGMKLRDALILSDQDKLIFKMKDVITFYKPVDILVDYYRKAVEYSNMYTRQATHKQIKYAIEDLDEMVQEEKATLKSLMNILSPGSNKIH